MPVRGWERAALLARLFLGGLFIYASLHKIAHPARFAEIVYYYRLLPSEAVNLVALVEPWVELVCGILLVAGRLRLPAAGLLSGLLVIFTAAVAFNLARGLDFQCGCFSLAPQARGENFLTLVRNLVLFFPAGLCLADGWKRARAAPSGTENL